jgi:RHS repeat-associated protein
MTRKHRSLWSRFHQSSPELRSRPKRPALRPQVELLEDRTLPSVLLEMLNLNPVREDQSTSNITLASFRSEDHELSKFSGSIHWGDGTTSNATLEEDGAEVSVRGSHVYTLPGAYEVTVEVTGPEAELDTKQTTGILVLDAPLMAGAPMTVHGHEGAYTYANDPNAPPEFAATLLGTFVDNGYTLGESTTQYYAYIDPGDDGEWSMGYVSHKGNGLYGVYGGLVYYTEGSHDYTVYVHSYNTPASGSAFQSLGAAVVLSGSAEIGNAPLWTAPGRVNPSQPYAYFGRAGQPGLVELISAYSATIDWGDGAITTGTIAPVLPPYPFYPDPVGFIFGVFSPPHSYAQNGTYTQQVFITAQDGTQATVVNTFVIGSPLPPPGSGSGGGESPPDVPFYDVSLYLQGLDIQVNEEETFQGAVATYSDAREAGNEDYTIQIDWGDGGMSAGTMQDGQIIGTHRYRQWGSYTTGVRVMSNTEYVERFTAGTVTVADLSWQSDETGSFEGVAEEELADLLLGSFTDDNVYTLPTDYRVTVDWGDGTSSLGEVEGEAGSFQIFGSHTYTRPGQYTARARATDQRGNSGLSTLHGPTNAMLWREINIHRRPDDHAHLHAMGQRREIVEGEEFQEVLALVFDENPAIIPECHEAAISWGDGQVDHIPFLSSLSAVEYGEVVRGVIPVRDEQTGEIIRYEVHATHTYRVAGQYGVRITTTDHAGRSYETMATVTVTNPHQLTAQGKTVTWLNNYQWDGLPPLFGNSLISLATFEDTYTDRPLDQYEAEVTFWWWGFSSPHPMAATIVGSHGKYHVVIDSNLLMFGAAEYIHEGSLPMQIIIGEKSGLQFTTTTATLDFVFSFAHYFPMAYPVTGMLAGGGYSLGPGNVSWGDGRQTRVQGWGGQTEETEQDNTMVQIGHIYRQPGTYAVHWGFTNIFGAHYPFDQNVGIERAPLDILAATPLVVGTTTEDTGLVTLLSFLDFNPNSTAANFTATVAWGDGAETTGIVEYDPGTRVYLVKGNHAYMEEGLYDVVVTLSANDSLHGPGGGNALIGTTQAQIGDYYHLQPNDLGVLKDIPTGEIVIATIWNANHLLAKPEDFTATIEIDGETFTGRIRRKPAHTVEEMIAFMGTFEVMATLKLSNPGESRYKLTVRDHGMGLRQPIAERRVFGGLFVHDGAAKAKHRTEEPEQSAPLGIGPNQASLNTGSLQLSHELDFDLNPSTLIGGAPRLVYNSGTVDVRPVLEWELRMDEEAFPPVQIHLQLTWGEGENQVVQNWVTFSTEEYVEDDTLVMGVQVAEPVTKTGNYFWRLHAFIEFDPELELDPVDAELEGHAQVIVRDQTEDTVRHPFGMGWGLMSWDQLWFVHGGVIWDNGSGFGRFFEFGDQFAAEGLLVSPMEDFGSLEQNDDFTFIYIAKSQNLWDFDEWGMLEWRTDTHGLHDHFEYDDDGKLERITMLDGGITTFEYQGDWVFRIFEPGFRTVKLGHDADGNLTLIRDPINTDRTFTYDDSHRLVRDQWEPMDTAFAYHATYGTLSQIDRGLGTTYTITPLVTRLLNDGPIKKQNLMAEVKDGLNHVTKYMLDDQGRQNKRVRVGDNGTELTEFWLYNFFGQVLTYTDALNRTTTYIYEYEDPDFLGDLMEVRHPDATVTKYDYHPVFHKVVRVRDALSRNTVYEYDSTTGDLLFVINAKNQITAYTYYVDPNTGLKNGLVKTVQNARGFTTTYVYDQHRRLQNMIQHPVDGVSYVTTYMYDGRGNPWMVLDPRHTTTLPYITYTNYDALNRLLSTVDAEGNTSSTRYYASGIVFEEENANGIVTRHEYDRRGFLFAMTEGINPYGAAPDERQTLYAYDAAGNLVSMTTGLGMQPHVSTTTYAYDAFNRRRAMTEATGTSVTRTTSYDYDAVGNLVLQVDPLGRWTVHEYDDMDRRWQTTFNAGSVYENFTTTEYDPVGNAISVITGQGGLHPHVVETFYVYDELNRVVERIDGFNSADEAFAINGYEYDAVGNLKAIIDPRGVRTSYGYDELDRLRVKTEAATETEERRTEMNYDSVGNLIWQKRGIAGTNPYESVTTFVYYRNDRLKSKAEAVGEPEARTTNYFYDAVGNLRSETIGIANNPNTPLGYGRATTTSYVYDTLNRLKEKYEGWISGVGASEGTSDQVTLYRYDAADNLIAMTTGRNMVLVFAGIPTTLFYYDELNRRIATREAALRTEQRWTGYVYDAADRLEMTISPRGTVTWFGYDDNDNQTTVIEAWDTLHERTTTREFDTAGNLLSETVGQASGASISVDGYDHPETTTYSYDTLNRRTAMTEAANVSALSRTSTFQYDANGNLLRQISPRNITTFFEYDHLNRRITIIEAEQATDGTQRRADFKYDAADNLIEETKWQAANFAIPLSNRYEYDRLNRLKKIIEATNEPAVQRTTTINYDAVDNRVSVTAGQGNFMALDHRATTEYAYDDMHRVVVQREAVGTDWQRETYFTYDEFGNLSTQESGISPVTPSWTHRVTTTFAYDLLHRRTAVTEAAHDAQFRRTTTMQYDAEDNLVQVTDPRGAITVHEYDALNRRTATTEALGTLVERTALQFYDATDNLVVQTTGLATGFAALLGYYNHPSTTVTFYDALNRRVSVTVANETAAEQTTTFEYMPKSDNLVKQTDYLGHATQYQYDSLDRRTKVIDPVGNVTEIYYWSNDKQARIIQPAVPQLEGYPQLGAHWIGYVYNALGQLTRIIDGEELGANARVTTMTYDAAGNLTSTIDPTGTNTISGYDKLNRRHSMKVGEQPYSQYARDAADNLLIVLDPTGKRTTYTYDALNRQSSVIDPYGATTVFQYDAAGNLVKQTDRNNRVRTLEYDALNRKATEKWFVNPSATTPTETLSYLRDAADNLLTATNAQGTVTMTYDALNRLASSQQPLGSTLTYNYGIYLPQEGGAFSQVTMQDNWGGKTVSIYDEANRLKFRTYVKHDLTQPGAPAVPGSGFKAELTYTPRNQMRAITYHTTADLTAAAPFALGDYVYNEFGQPLYIYWRRNLVATGTPDWIYSDIQIYQYDVPGRLKQEARQASLDNNNPDSTFNGAGPILNYDGLSQLKTVANSGGVVENRDYDANGNPNGRVYLGDRLQSGRDQYQMEWQYFYDGEGNLIRKERLNPPAGPEKVTYEYDHNNNLIRFKYQAGNPGSEIVDEWRIDYDALGRRIGMTKYYGTLGIQTQFVLDGGNLYAEIRTNPIEETITYLHGDTTDQLFARYDSQNHILAYFQNHQQSVMTLLSAADKTIKSRYSYNGFGKVLNSVTPVNDRFGWTGRDLAMKEYPGDFLRLQYNRARWYDPSIERFITEDTMGFAAGDTNLYRYAGNSPTNATDPSGHIFATLAGGILGSALGTASYLLTATIAGEKISWSGVASAATGGFVAGAIAGAFVDAGYGNVSGIGLVAIGALAGLGGGATSGLIGSTGQQIERHGFDTSKWDGREILNSTFIGGVSGAVGGALGAGLMGSSTAGLGRWIVSGVSGGTVGGALGGGMGAWVNGGDWKAGMLDGAWKGAVAGGFSSAVGYGAVNGGRGPTAQRFGKFMRDGWSEKAHGNGWLRFPAYWSGKALGLRVCFAAGTPLLTPEGSKLIEQFRVGDLILSRNEFDPEGPIEPKVVEEVFVRVGQILHLHVGGQVIRTTAEHPFYAYNKGWKAAAELRVGDRLLSHDGQWLAVDDLLDTGEFETVYNLRIAEFRTYFVGSREWGSSVWAHNTYVDPETGALATSPRNNQIAREVEGQLRNIGFSKREARLLAKAGAAEGMNGQGLRDAINNGDLATRMIASGGRGVFDHAVQRVLPEFDGARTQGVLITNEGDVIPFQNRPRDPAYRNYESAAHADGKAAIWIRENNSSGGTFYHNHPYGTCGYCYGQTPKFLPKDIPMRIVPPRDAKAPATSNNWWKDEPVLRVGNEFNP